MVFGAQKGLEAGHLNLSPLKYKITDYNLAHSKPEASAHVVLFTEVMGRCPLFQNAVAEALMGMFHISISPMHYKTMTYSAVFQFKLLTFKALNGYDQGLCLSDRVYVLQDEGCRLHPLHLQLKAFGDVTLENFCQSAHTKLT